LLVSVGGGELKLWQGGEGKGILSLKPEGKGGVWAAAFAPGGGSFGRGGRKNVKFRGLNEGEWVGSLGGPRKWLLPNNRLVTPTRLLRYSPDGKMLAQLHDEGVDLWDVGRRTRLYTITGHPFSNYAVEGIVSEAVTGLAFSPDGRLLATCGWDG